MSQSAYSDLKAAWHIDKLAALRDRRLVVPSQVELILSDFCNQDCSFCSYRMSNGLSSEQFVEHLPDGTVNRNPKRMITEVKALEILRDCAACGVGAIQFTGGGEPTVHPQHMELFRETLDLGMQAALVTNGVLLRDDWQEILPRFAWIRVSLDAGTAEGYSKLRGVPAPIFPRVLANIKRLAESIRQAESKCLLGVGYVLTPENWKELVPAVEQIKATGSAYVRISAMFSKDGEAPFMESFFQIRDEIRKATALQSDTFRVVDRFGARIADLKQEHPDYSFCGYQHFTVYIGGNLKVYRCCSTAYTLHGEVGDLSNLSFADWVYSFSRQKKYFEFDAKSCGTCQFNRPNEIISYIMEENPLHVSFV